MTILLKQSQMPLPRALIEMMASGSWVQPSDAIIKKAIPFLLEPVDLLKSEARMRSESSGQCVGFPHMREYRGSESEARPLPWIDADLSLFIAVNREAGADFGIVLDYRENINDPKIVASDWWTGDNTLHWREVFPSFSALVKALEL